MKRRWLTVTRDEKPDSDRWFWDDEDFPERGMHFSVTTPKRTLGITLEPGELTVRTRYRYFQPAFSAQVHLLRKEGRWAYAQSGTRTLWLWGRQS